MNGFRAGAVAVSEQDTVGLAELSSAGPRSTLQLLLQQLRQQRLQCRALGLQRHGCALGICLRRSAGQDGCGMNPAGFLWQSHLPLQHPSHAQSPPRLTTHLHVLSEKRKSSGLLVVRSCGGKAFI